MDKKFAKNNPIKKLPIARNAFTLAEVLVTLMIIGVVAAMTIPSLVQNTQNLEYVVAFKKSYASFSNAIKLVEADNGVTDMISTGVFSNSDSNVKEDESWAAFKKHLSIAKDCGRGSHDECWGQGYTSLSGNYNGDGWPAGNDGFGNKAILADGSMIMFEVFGNGNCAMNNQQYLGGPDALKSTCALLYLDVNGPKKPNTLGRDFFILYITNTGMQPFPADSRCDTSYNDTDSGLSCAGKVLSEGAMNY